MMLFDSITAFSANASSLRIRGIASDRSPCRVLTQNDPPAPVFSAVSQSHGPPLAEHIPCPNCVILNAVQCISGIAAINPATTLVFPIFLVCPPTTTIAILATKNHQLASILPNRKNYRCFRRARSRKYSFKGRAGLPQNTSPAPRIFFPLSTPPPPPRITPAPTVACSPIPTCPPRIAPSSTPLDPEIPA